MTQENETSGNTPQQMSNRSRPQSWWSKVLNPNNTNENSSGNGAELIVSELIAQGQLTRNTGANSIKTIDDKLTKFSGVFDSISKELMIQTTVLKNILNENYLEYDRLRRQDEEARLYDSERREHEKDQLHDTRHVEETKQKKLPFETNLFNSSILGNLLGGGFITGMVRLLNNIKNRLGSAIIMNLLGDQALEFIETEMERIGISKSFAEAVTEPFSSGIFWGSLGMLVSKRLGAYMGVAGFTGTLAGELMEKMGFSEGVSSFVSTVVSSSSVLALHVLTSKELMSGLGNTIGQLKSNPSVLVSQILENSALKGKALLAMKSVRLGIGALVVGALTILHDPLIKGLEKMGLSEGFATQSIDGLTSVATGASLGMMFGPTGAIVGAVLGLTWWAGNSIYDWLTDEKRIAAEQVDKATQMLKINNKKDYIMTGEELARLRENYQDAIESDNKEAIEMYKKILEIQESRRGGKIATEQDLTDFQSYMDENSDILTKRANAIGENQKLSEDEKTKALISMVNELQQKFPQFSQEKIAEELEKAVGDMHWGFGNDINDANDIFEKLSKSTFWTIKGAGDTTLSEGIKKVMDEYSKTHGGNQFDPNKIDDMKWLSENKELLNLVQKMNAGTSLFDTGVDGESANILTTKDPEGRIIISQVDQLLMQEMIKAVIDNMKEKDVNYYTQPIVTIQDNRSNVAVSNVQRTGDQVTSTVIGGPSSPRASTVGGMGRNIR